MTDPNANQDPKTKPGKKIVDWHAIGVHYRAGVRALKDIGREFGVSDAAIIKHARKQVPPWTRDLKGKIQARADAKVSAAMVSDEVSAQTKITEAVTIDVESTVQSRIRLSHRTDIGRMRSLVMHLTAEVELQSLKPEFFIELEHLIAGIPKGATLADMPEGQAKLLKVSAGLEKALSLSSRTVTLKALVESFTRLVAMEREAFGINSANQDFEDPFSLMLRSLQGSARTIVPIAEDPDLLPAP